MGGRKGKWRIHAKVADPILAEDAFERGYPTKYAGIGLKRRRLVQQKTRIIMIRQRPKGAGVRLSGHVFQLLRTVGYSKSFDSPNYRRDMVNRKMVGKQFRGSVKYPPFQKTHFDGNFSIPFSACHIMVIMTNDPPNNYEMRHNLIFFKPEIPISSQKDIPVIDERLAFASVEAKFWSFVISLWNRDGCGITVPRELTLSKKVNDRMIQYIEFFWSGGKSSYLAIFFSVPCCANGAHSSPTTPCRWLGGSFPDLPTGNQFFTPTLFANFCRYDPVSPPTRQGIYNDKPAIIPTHAHSHPSTPSPIIFSPLIRPTQTPLCAHSSMPTHSLVLSPIYSHSHTQSHHSPHHITQSLALSLSYLLNPSLTGCSGWMLGCLCEN